MSWELSPHETLRKGERNLKTVIALLLLQLAVLPVVYILSDRVAFFLWVWGMIFIFLSVALGFKTARNLPEVEPSQPLDPAALSDLMNIKSTFVADGTTVFRGQLRSPPSEVYESLKSRFLPEKIPLLQEDEEHDAAIAIIPLGERPKRAKVRLGLHLLLFFLTLLTTTAAGALIQGGINQEIPLDLFSGLSYAVGLLAILGVHEFGHYSLARKHGMDVSPPYFIPVPFALGTFGAFIRLRSPAENRQTLFDVAVAGPIAGLCVAIPALVIGLHSSTFVPIKSVPSELLTQDAPTHSSLLFSVILHVVLGPVPESQALQLSPLAFAAWLGIYITALNLMPVGQLDGGHLVAGMFGQRLSRRIGKATVWTLFLVSFFLWPSLLMWSLIVFLMAGRSATPLNDLTPLSPRRMLLGYVSFAILAAILLPAPQYFSDEPEGSRGILSAGHHLSLPHFIPTSDFARSGGDDTD